MAKIVISPIRGGFNLSTINAAFAEIVKQLNELVLYRNNPTGEPNEVKTDIDLNNKRIYNVPAPVEDSDIVRYKEVKEAMAVVNGFDPAQYVSRSEYDSLLLRIEALEASVFPSP